MSLRLYSEGTAGKVGCRCTYVLVHGQHYCRVPHVEREPQPVEQVLQPVEQVLQASPQPWAAIRESFLFTLLLSHIGHVTRSAALILRTSFSKSTPHWGQLYS